METYIRNRFNVLVIEYCELTDSFERAPVWGRMCELYALANELNLDALSDEINKRLDEELSKFVGGDK